MNASKNNKLVRGRPRLARHEVRSNRIVTFVTETELGRLEEIAADEDRSLSGVVHRIILSYIEGVNS
jgi:hypothetical protein